MPALHECERRLPVFRQATENRLHGQGRRRGRPRQAGGDAAHVDALEERPQGAKVIEVHETRQVDATLRRGLRSEGRRRLRSRL